MKSSGGQFTTLSVFSSFLWFFLALDDSSLTQSLLSPVVDIIKHTHTHTLVVVSFFVVAVVLFIIIIVVVVGSFSLFSRERARLL